MLELRDVSFRYPGAQTFALQGIDLQLQEGQCLGLLGSNGAGKTTLLALLSDTLALQQGEIRWSGPRSLGLVPQQLAFYAELTVAENLALFADLYRLHGAQRRQRLELCIASSALEDKLQRRATRLSGGEQRRLNFAIGLLQPARLYLFDEATVGVDAGSRQLLLDAVERLAAAGHGVIYTSHYLDEVERVAGRILLLHEGKVRLDVDKRQLLDAGHGLLLEWPQQVPAGFLELLGQLHLSAETLPDGLRIDSLDGRQLLAITQFLAAQPTPPSLLRFGRPSLEQLYLSLNGGRPVSPLLALIRKECLLLLRDPHALAVLFIMPILFLVLMAAALSNYLRDQPPPLSLVLEVPRSSEASQFFHEALMAQLPGSLLLASSDEALPRISLASDFSETLLDIPHKGPTLSFPARVDSQSRQRLRAALNIALAQTRLLAYLQDSEALPADMTADERWQLIRQRTQSEISELQLLASGELSGKANASQLSVPAWLIFGMFFVALPMAGGFQREQQSGALLRFRALGLSPTTLVLSKLLPYLAINLLQFALLLAIGVHVLPLLGLSGLSLPGSPLAYLLLALSLSLAACSLGLLLAALARSGEQALLLGGGLNIILAAIGGIMVPKSVMPEAMSQLAEISPMSWALDAFLTLLVGQGDLADIAPDCARLLLFALLLGGGGLLLFRKRVQQTQWTTHY